MVALVVAVALLAALLIIIFALARQDIRQTGDTALRVERWLMGVVPPTGTGSIGEPTWAGLTIRRLAHIAEYGALGLVAACAWVLAVGPGFRSLGFSLVFCLVASVADEVHKRFVPGRHFDTRDLMLDALSYVPTVLAVTGLACILS